VIATDATAGAPNPIAGGDSPAVAQTRNQTRPTTSRRAWRIASELVPIAALAAFVTILLRGPLGGAAMMSYDLYVYFFPAKHFILEAFRRGEWPLWNPAIFFGAPFLANIQMAVLYPPDVIFLWPDFARAVAASQWFHLVAGGSGFYWLARRGWGLGPWGASFGATAFTGSGFLGAHMGHLNQVHAATWLPWLALATHRGAAAASDAWRARFAHRHGSQAPHLIWQMTPEIARLVRWVAAGAVATALLITAGHTQETYYTLLALGGEATLFALAPPRRALVHLCHVGALALSVGLGASLAAAQLVPTLELVHQGYRAGGMPRDEAGSYAIDRTHLLETLLPTYWNLPAQEVTGYVGTVVLPFASVALAASPARRQVLALATTAGIALVLGLGTYTSLFDTALLWLPLFSSFRAPGRWLLIWTYAVAGLAAHGLDAVDLRGRLRWPASASATTAPADTASSRRSGLVRAVIGSLAIATLALGVAGARTWVVGGAQWLPPGRVALVWLWCGASGAMGVLALAQFGGALHALTRAGVLAIATAELALAGHRMEYTWPVDPVVYTAPSPVAPFARDRLANVSPDASPPRLVSLTVEQHLDAARLARSTVGAEGDTIRYRALQDALKPNLGLVYGLPTIDGYDGGLLPLRTYARFKSVLLPTLAAGSVPHLSLAAEANGRADARRFASLGVAAVISDGRNGSPGNDWRTFDDAPGAAWWHDNAIPMASRALVVDQVIVVPDDQQAVALLRTLDLTTVATVASPIDGIESIAMEPSATGARPEAAPRSRGSAGTARVRHYGARVVEIEATALRPALVVLTDTDYPGWRATVDGVTAPVIRVDTMFRGVAISAGTHVVRFEFVPWSVHLGAAVSAVALVLIVAAVSSTVRRSVPRPFALSSQSGRGEPKSRALQS
jgi:hypothetical protein